jgi:arylsulfatase A-like enzyme
MKNAPLGSLLCLLLIHVAFANHAKAALPPNILFIFADDWGWGDLSCHGHPYVKTPNIDRLAAEGTDFHRFTVASGVCSPSRAAIFTGHFPARYNIDGHFAWVSDNAKRNMPDWLHPDSPSLPRFLKSAGYATAHFGKWHLSNNMIPDSPTPDVYGYDEYGAFNCAGEQIPVHEDADRTKEFIEKSNRDGKPFFVNWWLHEPHTPHHVVPKYQWRFRELPENDNIYASVLSHADDRIGEVLDTLDRLNIAQNTLVIFSSDNGPARAAADAKLDLQYDSATGAGYGLAASKGLTGGRKGYKAALYEGGIGVPFIVRWPSKVAAGKVDQTSLISAVDLLPTFCEVAGVNLPASYQPDGVSQLATLLGTPAPLRNKPLFWKIQGKKNSPFHWAAFAVVDQQWKLLIDTGGSQFELYDIKNDPLETKDLSQELTEVVQRLQQKLAQWQSGLPDKPSGNVFSIDRSTRD